MSTSSTTDFTNSATSILAVRFYNTKKKKMPVRIPPSHLEWRQTTDKISLVVPLRGVPTKRVDVYLNDVYLKLHFAPYILEVDLLHAIDHGKAVVTLGDGLASISLPKVIAGQEWESLSLTTGPGESAAFIMERRRDAEARYQQTLSEAKGTAVDWTQKQLDVERESAQHLKSLMDKERTEAEADLKQWTTSTDKQEQPDEVPPIREFAKITCNFSVADGPSPLADSLVVESIPRRTRI
eukprot:Partr_v1_DN28653_c1_g1_i8_m49660 putative dyslexia susceptibility 1 candidate 1